MKSNYVLVEQMCQNLCKEKNLGSLVNSFVGLYITPDEVKVHPLMQNVVNFGKNIETLPFRLVNQHSIVENLVSITNKVCICKRKKKVE